MVKLLEFLDMQMTRPESYGWFHLMFVGITIAVTLLLCVFFRNCNDKTFRRIILIFWIIIVILEIYKEINYTFSVSDGEIVAKYQWYIFPFQFCSTPFYVLPFIVFLKEGKVRDACIAFTAIFALVAGLAVMIYPNDVFIGTIGINIQTMVHHGSQVILGIFCCVHERKKYSGVRFCLSAVAVFAALSAVAMLLNEIFIYIVPEGETFNMFYISRHFPSTLVILCDIYKAVPYPVFLLAYFFAFGVGAAVIYLIQWGIIRLTSLKKKNKNKEIEA